MVEAIWEKCYRYSSRGQQPTTGHVDTPYFCDWVALNERFQLQKVIRLNPLQSIGAHFTETVCLGKISMANINPTPWKRVQTSLQPTEDILKYLSRPQSAVKHISYGFSTRLVRNWCVLHGDTSVHPPATPSPFPRFQSRSSVRC